MSFNLPTWITLLRLLGAPLLLACLAVDTPGSRGWAAVIFGVAAGTDWLDGYLARRWQQETELGALLDPLVDKLLILAPLLGLVATQQIPAWGAFLIIGRELAITGWRSRQATVQGAKIWGKAKTVVQCGAILLLLLRWPGALVVFWGAIALTLISGWLYVRPVEKKMSREPEAEKGQEPGSW